MNKTRKTDSDRFYDRIAKLLVEARSSVVQTINKTMVHTYFEIGRMIVEEEQNGNIRANEAILSHLLKNADSVCRIQFELVSLPETDANR
jgi:hypothetical protein